MAASSALSSTDSQANGLRSRADHCEASVVFPYPAGAISVTRDADAARRRFTSAVLDTAQGGGDGTRTFVSTTFDDSGRVRPELERGMPGSMGGRLRAHQRGRTTLSGWAGTRPDGRAPPRARDNGRLMAIRVILAEDNYLAREGIVRVLESIDDVDVVAAYGDLETVREGIDSARPDVVITDIRMPPSHTDEGIRLADELRTTQPDVGVVVLSQHADPMYALALFDQGAARRAYLLKERVRDRAELGRAVREVANGGSVVDPRIVEGLLSVHTRRGRTPFDELTPRELQILGLIADGRSNTAIAGELVVTKRAVERHINAIFRKLELEESEDVSRRVTAALLYLAQ
jgi:DNA-binding NarL/FixJ family response regulator